MSWLNLISLALAVGAVIDVLHNGSIFATWRAYVSAKFASTPPEDWRATGWELLSCPYCQSYHVPIILLLLAGALWCFGLDELLWFGIYGLAATRLSNLLNAALPPHMRYDRDSDSNYRDDHDDTSQHADPAPPGDL